MWTEEECRKYPKPCSPLLDEKVTQDAIEVQTLLPRVINAESFDLHSTWRNSVGTTAELDISLTGGANGSVVDVCMVKDVAFPT